MDIVVLAQIPSPMNARPRRKEPRTSMRLPVRVFGTDDLGRPFNLMVQTVDIALMGARLRGVRHLEVGSTVQLEHGRSRARYRVAWINVAESQLGLECLEPSRCIWGSALPQPANLPSATASAAAATR